MGEAAVTDKNEICHVFAIITTDDKIEFEIPSQEILSFEYYKLPWDDFDENFTDKDEDEVPINTVTL